MVFTWYVLILVCFLKEASTSPPENLGQLIVERFSSSGVLIQHYYLCQDADWLYNRLLGSDAIISVRNLEKSTGTVNLEDFESTLAGIFLDLSCSEGSDFFRRSSESGLLKGQYHWIVWSDSLDDGLTEVAATNVSIDADLTLVTEGYVLFDLYKVHRTGPVKSLRMGTWSPESGLIPEKQKEIRNNFRGFTLNVSLALVDMEPNPSLDMLSQRIYIPDTPGQTRFTFDMMTHFREMFNFSYNYKIGDAIGGEVPGDLSGMVGDLARGDVDFGLQPSRLRKDTLDFASPLFTARVTRTFFSLVQPRTFSTYKALIVPFTAEVWIYFGGLIALISVTYRIISMYDHSPDIDSWGATIIQTVGAITQQGFEDRTNLTSSRLVSFFLLLLSAISFVYYNAAVLNSLLSPNPPSILSLDDLLYSGMDLGLWNIPLSTDIESPDSVLGNPEDDITRRIVERLNKTSPRFVEMVEGVDRMRDSSFSLFSDDSLIFRPSDRLLTDAEKCALYQLDTVSPYHSVLLAVKNSPYREILIRALLWMKEVGLHSRALKLWFDTKSTCRWRQEAVSIGPVALFLAYVSYGVGVFLSHLFFFFELLIKKERKK